MHLHLGVSHHIQRGQAEPRGTEDEADEEFEEEIDLLDSRAHPNEDGAEGVEEESHDEEDDLFLQP